jgi:hypothetical protein
MPSSDTVITEAIGHPRERHHHDEDTDLAASTSALLPHAPPPSQVTSPAMDGFRAKLGLAGVARRTLGLACLMVTVLLWTLYNFMASVRVPAPIPSLTERRPNHLRFLVHPLRPILR